MQLLPLLQRQETLGGWCAIPSWLTAEVVGGAGFDWVCVDAQHGPVGTTDVALMLLALRVAGVPSLVRVGWNEPVRINQALDAGADGVIVPLVNSVADAVSAARACRYPPDGTRSYGPTVAALRWRDSGTDVTNSRIVCLVQIETQESLECADEIAAVAGVDGLLVGPADLSRSLGFPAGDVDDARFREATRGVVRACETHGKVPAMFCGSPQAALLARADGFRMLAVQSDVRFLKAGAALALAALRDADHSTTPTEGPRTT